MKKLLLTLASAVALAFSASAAEPTVVDFTAQEPFSGGENIEKTIDGVTFTILNNNVYLADGSKYDQANYLMLKNTSPRGAFQFSLPFDCSRIVVTTSDSPSTNPGNKVTLYANDKTVIEQAINKAKSDFTFDLGTYTASGTVYKFEATGSKNSQIAKLTLYPVTDEASISIDDKILSFVTVLNGEQTLSFKVNASNVTGDLTVTSSNAAFTPAKSTYTVDEAAEGIEISFTGTSTELVEGIVTVAAGNVSADIDAEGFAVAHAGTEADPLTVSDVLAMNSRNAGPFYVTGVIGDLCAATAKNGMITEVADASKNTNSNIILKEGDKMIGVALPSGATRDKLNIVSTPENAGKTVVVKGTLEQYFSAPGVKNTEYVSGLDETGIDNITADNNAPAEYYNLQGVRVANPANGLYIRRQGNNVTKVYVK